MKAIVKAAAGPGLECVDLPEPEPGPGEVKLRVRAAAICGADIHFHHWDPFAENMRRKYDMRFPAIIGHEGAGEVVAVGPGTVGVRPGDRVAIETHIPCGRCYQCQNGMRHNCADMGLYAFSRPGCFAEYAVAPERVCYHLPGDVSYEEGALLEPAGVAMRAIEESRLEPGDAVLVYGCGPIGLMAIQMLNACGAATVIGVDVDGYRLAMAEQFGCVAINAAGGDVLERVRALTRPRGGVDAALEMTGAAQVYETVLDAVRIEGRLVSVGHTSAPVPVDVTNKVNMKGLMWKGVFGRRIWETWWKVAGLAAAKKVALREVVTHRFPLGEHRQAFEQIGKGAGKVVFLP